MYTPILPSVTGIAIKPGNIKELTCYKEAGHWYISLAQYMKQKGVQACTEVAAITDGLLAWISRRRNRFTVLLDTLPFDGARVLELDELCTGPEGGAYYRLITGRNNQERRLWVCDTSLLVFGDLPPRIFFRLGSK